MDRDLMDFELGRPALVCRWRLQAGELPLKGRHLRALSDRRVAGAPLEPPLIAWVSQHLEWTLAEGAAAHPDGTLMLVVDEQGRAAMGVGPYVALRDTDASVLASRARAAQEEARVSGVAPEELMLICGDVLVREASAEASSGACSLVGDLARTLGMEARLEEGLADRVCAGEVAADEAVILVSDEHGVVVARGCENVRARQLEAGYARLLEVCRERHAVSWQ